MNIHKYYINYGELNRGTIKIEFEASDTKQEMIYTIGREDTDYQDDPMLEYQTYIKFIYEDVMWNLGEEEAERLVNDFLENTLEYLKRQGITG